MPRSNGDETAREGPVPIRKRSLLRATGAATLGGIAGCLGTVEREYEATPVALSEEVAREHGFVSEPTVEQHTATPSKDLGVVSVDVEVTAYTYRYEYRGKGAGESGAPTTPTAGTATPTPADAPDGSAGTPQPEEPGDRTRTPTDTPGREPEPDDDPDDGVDTTPPPDTGPQLPSSGGGTGDRPAGDGSTAESAGGNDGDPGGARREYLTVNVVPSPSLAGQSLNPASEASVEKLIETRTELVQQACGCEIGRPEAVSVESTANPREARYRPADVGRRVRSWSGSDRDLPTTTTLLGTETGITYFAFASRAGDGGVRPVFLATAKATTRLDGTRTVVLATYVVEGEPFAFDAPRQVLTSQSGDGERGLFAASLIGTVAERFASVVPDLGGARIPTPADAPTPVATPGSVEWSATVERRLGPLDGGGPNPAGPFYSVRFESELGTIEVLLPDDLAQGDPIYASIGSRPAGDGANDRKRLGFYDVRVGDASASPTADGVSTRLAADATALGVTLLRDGSGVASASVDVRSYEPEYPFIPEIEQNPADLARLVDGAATADYMSRIYGEPPAPLAVWGPFDTNPSTTTFSIDGTDRRPLVETPRRAIAWVPEVSGETSIALTERGRTIEGRVQFGTDQQGSGQASFDGVTRIGHARLSFDTGAAATGRGGRDSTFGAVGPPARGATDGSREPGHPAVGDGERPKRADPVGWTPQVDQPEDISMASVRLANGKVYDDTKVTPGKLSALRHSLVQLWEAAWKAHWKDEIAFRQVVQQVSREALRIARALLTMNRTKKRRDGWDGGWDHNLEVGYGSESGGKCWDWKEAGAAAVKKLTLDFFRRRNLINAGTLRFTHYSIGIEPILCGCQPPDAGIEYTLVYDPWRNNGRPYWVRTTKDLGWNWKFSLIKPAFKARCGGGTAVRDPTPTPQDPTPTPQDPTPTPWGGRSR